MQRRPGAHQCQALGGNRSGSKLQQPRVGVWRELLSLRLNARSRVLGQHTDGGIRDGAWVAEVTAMVDLSSWPEGSRLILRKEGGQPEYAGNLP